MPPVEGAEYLLGYLWEVGPTMASGGYPGPVTHQELRAWMDLTGIELEPWEARFLRRLSGEYLAQSQKAEKENCPAPTRETRSSAVDVAAVASNLQNTLKNLAKM